jgi:peptidoglycan hydrolase CwlO-like protein
MGKKRKGEKLERVLAELQRLKSEVKALAKQQADVAVLIDKLTAKKPAARAAQKPVAKKKPKAAVAVAARKASASKRPVLVAPPDTATG